MKKLLYLSLTILVIVVTVFTSCKKPKDELPKVLQPAEAKTIIEQTYKEMENEYVKLKAHKPIYILQFLRSLQEGEKLSKNTLLRDILLFNSINLTSIINNLSRQSASAIDPPYGIYEFDFTTHSFKKTETNDKKIIILFPKDATDLFEKKLSAKINISNITAVTNQGGGEPEFIITSFKMNLLVDNIEALKVNYNLKLFNNKIPQNVYLNIESLPYSYLANLSFTNNVATGSIKLTNFHVNIIDFNYMITANFFQFGDEIDDITTAIRECERVEINNLTFKNISFCKGYAHPNAIDKILSAAVIIDENLANKVNREGDFAFFRVGDFAKIGDLKVIVYNKSNSVYESEDAEIVPAIVYSDGSYQIIDKF